MALTLLQTIKLIAPEMAAELEDDAINDFADLATAQSNFGVDPIKTQARAYLAAHMYTVSRRNGQSGAITRLREGALEIGYAINRNIVGLLESTSYGSEYSRLKKEHLFKPRTKVLEKVQSFNSGGF